MTAKIYLKRHGLLKFIILVVYGRDGSGWTVKCLRDGKILLINL